QARAAAPGREVGLVMASVHCQEGRSGALGPESHYRDVAPMYPDSVAMSSKNNRNGYTGLAVWRVLPFAGRLEHALVDEADRAHFHRPLLQLAAHPLVFDLHLLGHRRPAVGERLGEVLGGHGGRAFAALAD